MKKISCNRSVRITGLVATGLFCSPYLAQAQNAAENVLNFSEEKLLLGLIIFLAVSLLFIVLGLLFAIISIKGIIEKKPMAESSVTEKVIKHEESFWKKLEVRLTDAVPVDKEEAVMTDHEYDGIRELDNSLPPWWKAMFYATIVFSVLYMAAYHVFDWAQLQDEEYQTEVADAQAQIEAYMATKGDLINENTAELVTDETLLAEGKSIYDANCVACHGADLQGTVGPNLADSYWIHGGSVGDVFKTIHDGVPSKGMISWKAQLSPEQIQNLSSYIISMEGTNPAGGKEPQGELFTR